MSEREAVAAEGSQEAIARHLFELSGAVYRANPTEQAFVALSGKKPSEDDHASLSELVFEVAKARNFAEPTVGHLAQALAMEQRLHEAQHFCERWIQVASNKREPYRLAVVIACQRSDLTTAREAFRALKQMNADAGILWALETVILLAFFDGRNSTTTGRLALEASPTEPLAIVAACDAAYRRDDVALLIEAFASAPELAEERGRADWARSLLRGRLLELLRTRTAEGATQ